MVLVRVVSMVFRLAELAFAAIVAGITGHYLASVSDSSADPSHTWPEGRFIYTEVVAGLAILFAIIWLFPFSGSFIHWPTDIFISILWWVAFGLLVNFLNGSCGSVFNWNGIRLSGSDSCANFKADIAFTFLSAICWLASAFIGVYWVNRHTSPDAAHHRRRWYRSRV